MKSSHQSGFIELVSLMRKFSLHIDINLAKKFLQQYTKLVILVQARLPDNKLLVQRLNELPEIETNLESQTPGMFKVELQNKIDEIINELAKG